MSPSDLILAAVLITAPGHAGSNADARAVGAIQTALHKTAVEWEILDERETRYVLARLEDYEPDLNLLRRRYVDLAEAPLLADAARLPDRQAVNEFIRFNRAYRKNLETRQVWEADRADVIQVVVLETDRLYKVWDAVRDARCDFYYVTVRRQALKKLKDTLGPDAYASSTLPPYVPEWRFTQVR